MVAVAWLVVPLRPIVEALALFHRFPLPLILQIPCVLYPFSISLLRTKLASISASLIPLLTS